MAIVGRPNVGKSTLFNRLLRKRRAITDSQPGVTRDAVGAAWTVGDVTARLVDTGGVTTERDGYHSIVAGRSLQTIASARLVLLVMDVTEVTAEDELFLESMSAWRDKTILVVNKVDTEQRSAEAWNYHRFGYSEVVAISAEHGRGIDELCERINDRLRGSGSIVMHRPQGAAGESAQVTVRLAVIGQPNTGKSTLCNRLVGREASIVSEIPGTTRDVIEESFTYGGLRMRILDTAGIRRKRTVTENVEYYSVTRAIDTIDQSDVVLLLVDAQKGLSEQDKKIASLVVRKGRGIVIVLNKWDLMQKTGNRFVAVRDRIRFVFPVLEFAPVVAISARDGAGLDALLRTSNNVFRRLNTRIETARLNQALARWVARTPPPLAHRRPWKLRYITQVGVNPVVFVLFVNRSKRFPDAYLAYIRNQIRKEFGLADIPIQIEVRYSQKN
ncbi:MAG: ribosome biogenesis GTPase Der [Spirochaetaceae bacterium]|nr:MAG: ribosome biogenesis GTPase Der [Spirochaetaceae bacterium]